MNISFNLDPKHGQMEVVATYDHTDKFGCQFLLNRNFIVDELICDSKKLNICTLVKPVKINNYDYEVNLYSLPLWKDNLSIKYNGYLDGTTGMCPYVREKIASDFSFLRFETYCYPIFSTNDLQQVFTFLLRKQPNMHINITVPEGYTILSPANLINVENNNRETVFRFSANNNDLAFAIAKYEKVDLPAGNFYLFAGRKEEAERASHTLTHTYQYMNKHFGKVQLSTDIKYVSIPNGFGSFARSNCIFIEEKALTSYRLMRNIIHEFIHLGWNATTDAVTQRIRFFDEAFTNYFTLRVLESLLDKNDYLKEVERYKINYLKAIKRNPAKLVPIREFGKYEYGHLSYTIGALCLHELCKLVGRDVFDQATKQFLQKYKHQPADIETFCAEYMTLCDKPELKEFFDEWIYSTKAPKKLLNEMTQ